MRVYRDVIRETSSHVAIRRLERVILAGDPADALVEAGELEQAILDARWPNRDDWDDLATTMRALCTAVARNLLDSAPGARACRRESLRLLDVVQRHEIPRTLRSRRPEGYAHYGLDPVSYARAAASYVSEVGATTAARALVVGVRSIGTSLSAVVAAVCGAERSATVRPRGPIGSRRVAAARGLREFVRACTGECTDVLVVDEGPGATGETFECVNAWLRGLGVPADRIVFLGSRGGDMPLAPERRRAWYAGVRSYRDTGHDRRPEIVASRFGLADPVEIGGGRWRRLVPGAAILPACTGFERSKYLTTDTRGHRWQIRYAGLGPSRDESRVRAELLASRGLIAPPAAYDSGFAVLPWLNGTPLHRGERLGTSEMDAITRYLVGRHGTFATGRAVDVEEVVGAFLENCAAVPGIPVGAMHAVIGALESLPAREAVVADARMQPHEWIRTRTRVAKVDALEHGDGYRGPGPVDAAWDIAGAAVEFGVPATVVRRWIRECARASRENVEELARATRAYAPVYAASAYAEAVLSAAEAQDPADRRRLHGEAAFYRAAFRRCMDQGSGWTGSATIR
ncbi:MAG TPA: hypothetical protein VNZ57_04110 [Longimicrobiales bacterium]|nr:hypothetical protein [Longimicrobiales bacterium]